MKQILITIAALVLVGCGPSMSIHEAADEGNIEVVKQHLAAGIDVNAKDQDGCTPLHWAAKKGNKGIAELLIAKGGEVNANDDVGGTPLSEAAFWGHKEIVELLIAKGADVNAMRFDGTPLHLAIGHKEIIEILIAKGADVNSKSKAFNQTPIDAAADNKFFNQPDIIELLRKHGGKTGEELKAAGN